MEELLSVCQAHSITMDASTSGALQRSLNQLREVGLRVCSTDVLDVCLRQSLLTCCVAANSLSNLTAVYASHVLHADL